MRINSVFKYLIYSIAIAHCNYAIASSETVKKNIVPAWSYDGDYNGQEDWGALEGYEICREGFLQSPVNIGYTKTLKLPKILFDYKPSNGIMLINDKSFIAKTINGGSITIEKTLYNLKNIELHSPSSHHVKNSFNPLEIHLIHEDSNGNMLIVAVFAKVGDENPTIENLIKNAKKPDSYNFIIDTAKLIPASHGYYSYIGSLPYPPCTENVEWRIMKKPITISQKQLTEITGIIGRNTRLPQPLYVREVTESKD